MNFTSGRLSEQEGRQFAQSAKPLPALYLQRRAWSRLIILATRRRRLQPSGKRFRMLKMRAEQHSPRLVPTQAPSNKCFKHGYQSGFWWMRRGTR